MCFKEGFQKISVHILTSRKRAKPRFNCGRCSAAWHTPTVWRGGGGVTAAKRPHRPPSQAAKASIHSHGAGWPDRPGGAMRKTVLFFWGSPPNSPAPSLIMRKYQSTWGQGIKFLGITSKPSRLLKQGKTEQQPCPRIPRRYDNQSMGSWIGSWDWKKT